MSHDGADAGKFYVNQGKCYFEFEEWMWPNNMKIDKITVRNSQFNFQNNNNKQTKAKHIEKHKLSGEKMFYPILQHTCGLVVVGQRFTFKWYHIGEY